MPTSSLSPPTATALALVLAAGVVAAVPMPVEVRPGAAEADGVVAWTPAVQVVDGPVGGTVTVDLALDDGTDHPVGAALSVHAVELDDDGRPVAGGPSRALELATDRIALQPGDRGLVVAAGTIPPRPTLAAVRAELEDAQEPAAPLAVVLLRPDHDPAADTDIEVTIADLRDDRAEVVVANRGDGDAVVDLAVAARSWLGRPSRHEVTGLVLPAGSTREVDAPVTTGVGRRGVAVAAAARGGPTVRADVSEWTRRTLPAALATVLVLVAAVAVVAVLRRRRLT